MKIRCPHWKQPANLGAAGLALALLALPALVSCGGDATGPRIDLTIQVRDTVFIPNDVTIPVKSRVEWQNASSEDRTITSGQGPDDPKAGIDFDKLLAGYSGGQAIGGKFQMTFSEPDTIYYFSRLAPDGFHGTINGRIIIRN